MFKGGKKRFKDALFSHKGKWMLRNQHISNVSCKQLWPLMDFGSVQRTGVHFDAWHSTFFLFMYHIIVSNLRLNTCWCCNKWLSHFRLEKVVINDKRLCCMCFVALAMFSNQPKDERYKRWYSKVDKCIFNAVVARWCIFFLLIDKQS